MQELLCIEEHCLEKTSRNNKVTCCTLQKSCILIYHITKLCFDFFLHYYFMRMGKTCLCMNTHAKKKQQQQLYVFVCVCIYIQMQH